MPVGAVLGLALAIAGALMGGWIGARLGSDRIPRTLALRWTGSLHWLFAALALGLVAYGVSLACAIKAGVWFDVRPRKALALAQSG